MTTASWWAAHLESRLSQGDILPPVVVGSSVVPQKYLSRAPTQKHQQNFWAESSNWVADNDGLGLFLARGRQVHAVVLTHGCELDKQENKKVLIAPIFPINTLPDNIRSLVLAQERFAFLPLPDIPDLGTYYADMRCIVYVDRKLAESGKRLASMSPEGRDRLAVQLIGFFTRKEPK